jgi:NAD(P)-dependent dehydrogenase (short-subunit alcohol dehydrogenase family)
MDLRGRLVIVTGGGSGLGAAAARRLAAEGGIVAVVDRHGDGAAAVAAEIGRQAQPVALDVTDADRSAALLEDLRTSLGAPAVLVNCAGVAPAGRIVGKAGPMPLAEFRQVLEVNLVGTFNMLRLVAAAMAAAPADAEGERGVIVNTASVAAFEGQIGQAAYAASKGGVASLTLPAARELAPHGIRVVAIAPGLFATPMLAGMPTAVQESLAQSVPFPQRLGDPAEFADLVAHIVQNRMLNGCVIRLDGALRMAPR